MSDIECRGSAQKVHTFVERVRGRNQLAPGGQFQNGSIITNAKAFANEEGANRWFAYPRWTKDEKAIVYHASPSLYLYTLEDGTTVKVSTNDDADYRYPHCEATPK